MPTSPAIGDLDGDGKLEIISFLSQEFDPTKRGLYVVNADDGSLLWKIITGFHPGR